MEPILTESTERFCLFPISPKYARAFQMYLEQVACFWTVNEVDLGQDITDYESLTENEKNFILMILAFFANSDGIVNENLACRFSNEVKIPEIRQFYQFQIGMESIHGHMYALMIDTFERDSAKKNQLFRAIDTIPCVQKKAEWALRWIESTDSFAKRLVAFACVEGIFFSASFAAIYYFKKRGKMPGLTFSNELISRDEGMHRDFACYVYSLLDHKLDQNVVHEIIRSAVECEKMFVEDSLRVDLIGMNSKSMLQYVEFVADHLAGSLGYEKLFNSANPFEWMQLISLPGKTNFFEKRVGEYQKAGVLQQSTSRVFDVDADF